MASKRYTTEEFTALPQEEKLIAIASANVHRWGTLIPPREEQFSIQDKKCPECGKIGPVLRDFGVKIRKDGVAVPQSHCKTCRGKKPTVAERAEKRLPSNIAAKLSPEERRQITKMLREEGN